MAGWQSGYAAACKAVYAGSIPASASRKAMDKILITGAAGFIGSHLSKRLLMEGHSILGLDNMNLYYEQSLKQDRLKRLESFKRFSFEKIDISNKENLLSASKKFKPNIIINLAAQAGVRYSLENPDSYLTSNLIGFHNILETSKIIKPEILVYASSSSVYGGNSLVPFSELQDTSNTISLYAATKKSNEVMANSLSANYGIKTIGLRFFTVYGPWGRPDMAYYSFVNNLMKNKPITIFNDGNMSRDMTFIDDIIDGISAAINLKNSNTINSEIFNLGNSHPVSLSELIKYIEDYFNQRFNIQYKNVSGEVEVTFADLSHSNSVLGYSPKTNFELGMDSFLEWYKEYYKL